MKIVIIIITLLTRAIFQVASIECVEGDVFQNLIPHSENVDTILIFSRKIFTASSLKPFL